MLSPLAEAGEAGISLSVPWTVLSCATWDASCRRAGAPEEQGKGETPNSQIFLSPSFSLPGRQEVSQSCEQGQGGGSPKGPHVGHRKSLTVPSNKHIFKPDNANSTRKQSPGQDRGSEISWCSGAEDKRTFTSCLEHWVWDSFIHFFGNPSSRKTGL